MLIGHKFDETMSAKTAMTSEHSPQGSGSLRMMVIIIKIVREGGRRSRRPFTGGRRKASSPPPLLINFGSASLIIIAL